MLTKYPQPRNKIPVKFKKDWGKSERGVVLTKYPLIAPGMQKRLSSQVEKKNILSIMSKPHAHFQSMNIPLIAPKKLKMTKFTS